MARSTLSSLIETVRGLTAAGLSDYTLAGVTYWDADQVQKVLDRYRVDVYRELMHTEPTYTDAGSVEYKEYWTRYGNLETTSGGTAVFYIEDGTGLNVGTASYTPDYQRGRVEFTSDTGGSVYYLTARSYDINKAAADIWRQKAAHYAVAYDVSTDKHSLNRSQLIKNCLTMAAQFESAAGPVVVNVLRSDTDVTR